MILLKAILLAAVHTEREPGTKNNLLKFYLWYEKIPVLIKFRKFR